MLDTKAPGGRSMEWCPRCRGAWCRHKGSWGSPQVLFLAFSFLFRSFFHLKTPRNLKWISFTLYCLQQPSKNPWSSILHPWSCAWCLDVMIYMIPHYKTLKHTYGVAWCRIKLNYNDSSQNNTICSSNH